MGSAYAGLSSDGAAIFINPAGLFSLKHPQVIGLQAQPLSNINLTLLGGAFPNFLGGTIGFGYRNRTTSNVQASAEAVDYSEQDLTLLYARGIGKNLSLSGDLRFVSKALSKDVAGYGGLNGSGWWVDLGLKYFPRPWLGIGAALRNLGGRMVYQNNEVQEISWDGVVGISLKRDRPDLLFNLDLSKNAEEPLAQLHLGFEWWPVEVFAARLGADQSPKSPAENYFHATAGFGLKYGGFVFDYAFKKQGDPSQLVTHYFSLGYVGPKEKEIKPTAEAAVVVYPTPESVAVRKIKRLHFADLPQNYWAKEEIELLATAGVISGYPDGTFRPKQKVARGEFEKLLAAAKHLPPASILEPDQFITRAEAAKKLGLSGKLARPNEALIRAEFAAFLSQTSFGQAAIKRLPPLE